MLKFLTLLTALQICLQLGGTNADVNNRFQANIEEANGLIGAQQMIATKGNPETYKFTRPCLNRQTPHDANQKINNIQWTPTFKSSITIPTTTNFVPQSLKEDAQIVKMNENMLDVNKDDQPYHRKLNTFNSNNLPSSKVDCDHKIDQNSFRRSLSDSNEIITKQEEKVQSPQESVIPLDDNIPTLSDGCRNKIDSYINSRRSNTNNGNELDKKPSTSQDQTLLKFDISDSVDKTEGRSYHIKKLYPEPTSNQKYWKPNLEQEHTNSYGVTEMVDSSVMLIENTRTCYACSSASDPSCWHPNRRTTVKYCRKGHDACITRTFESSYGLVLTRDCGRSCEDISFPGLAPNYKSCSVCQNDLCNGAYTVKSHYPLFILLLITLIKYSM